MVRAHQLNGYIRGRSGVLLYGVLKLCARATFASLSMQGIARARRFRLGSKARGAGDSVAKPVATIPRRRGCQSFDSASPKQHAQVGGAPPAGQLPVATTSNGSFLNPMSPFAARAAPGSAARLVDDHDCQSQDTFLESSLQC